MKRIILYISIGVIFLFYSDVVLGFDDQITHPAITERVVKDVSALGSYLITTLGFREGVNTHLPSGSQNPNRTIWKLLTQGSTAEDHPMCRASHHFHNPLLPWLQSQMSDTPWMNYACDVPRYSNVTWATGYASPPPQGTKVNVAVSPFYSRVSWDSARDYFYKALTLTNAADRENYFAKTFEAVGQYDWRKYLRG